MHSETQSRLVSLPLRTWSGRLIDWFIRTQMEYFRTPFEFFGYYLLVNFPSYIETSTPLSRRSEQERSQSLDPEEIPRKQSSSLHCREVQTSRRTWEDSVRSSLRMKSLLQRTLKTTLPLKKSRSRTSEGWCPVLIREHPLQLSLCWNFNSAYFKRADGWTL